MDKTRLKSKWKRKNGRHYDYRICSFFSPIHLSFIIWTATLWWTFPHLIYVTRLNEFRIKFKLESKIYTICSCNCFQHRSIRHKHVYFLEIMIVYMHGTLIMKTTMTQFFIVVEMTVISYIYCTIHPCILYYTSSRLISTKNKETLNREIFPRGDEIERQHSMFIHVLNTNPQFGSSGWHRTMFSSILRQFSCNNKNTVQSLSISGAFW